DHAHAHRRQCEKGECESDAEEDDPELLALLVHGTVVLVLEAEAVDEGPELDDECGHRQGKKDETLKARDVFHSLTLAMTAAPSSPGRRILGNCPRQIGRASCRETPSTSMRGRAVYMTRAVST